MNIEVAPDEFWIKCTYNEAILYCFQLEIDGKVGWRLPTYTEWQTYKNDQKWRKTAYNSYGWFSDVVYHADTSLAIPVRDLYDIRSCP